jgi:uncharacterized membrane protein
MAFWLSHHPQNEWNRTYVLGGVRVCARCLGTYPVLLGALVAQLVWRAPLSWGPDVALALVLTLPALLDWARGRLAPKGGSNGVRTVTGVLLGVGLGRTLYVHLRSPWPPALRWQVFLIVVVAVPVLVLASRRNHE